MEGCITLVLGEFRIEATKTDLISKSKYFASLLSPNFKDSLSDVHHINYDIDTKTLQIFINWISEDANATDPHYRYIKPSLAKYAESSADFDDISQLLQLSALFEVETLVKDLTDLIACYWLTPERCLQLWLLAKELNLVTLRKLAQANCMERLTDVPESAILELTASDFVHLLGNVHAQAYPDLLVHLVSQWKLHNISSGETNTFDSHYPFTLSAEHISSVRYKSKFEDQKLKNNIQCVVGHKRIHDSEQAYIYSWDGTTFSELVEVRNSPTASTKSIIGMQVVGRGFDIYVIGGEYGLGTGRFEMEIWRYSTISKTWHYVTSLPEPRRHMAVKFLNEKLFVIGGVGRHRLKLSTVAVFNVYTAKWSKAADVPEDFTNIPPIFEISDSFAIYKSALYTYNPKSDSWVTSIGQLCGTVATNGRLETQRISFRFGTTHDGYMYIVDSGESPCPRIWALNINSVYPAHYLGNCITPFNNQVANGPYLIGFSYKDGSIAVEVSKLDMSKSLETLLVHSEKKTDVQDLGFDSPIGCFNILNPNTLDERFNVLDS